MNKKRLLFIFTDILYICLMFFPILSAIVIKILTAPASSGISVLGAQIYFTVPMPIQNLIISEAQINSWLVILSVLGLCLYLSHGLKTKHIRRRQIFAEWIVESVSSLVKDTMGDYFISFGSFICAILAISGFSSLLSLFGLFPPTSDINITAGWAILVFILITYYKFKCGPIHYIKSFFQPVPFLAPLNIISEIATPVSMAFRHYGNILSGTVISVLIAAGLQGLSKVLFGWLPGVWGDIPILQIGIPAVLSIYFDLFSGLLQAYIFAMLTMMYVSNGFPLEEFLSKKKQKN